LSLRIQGVFRDWYDPGVLLAFCSFFLRVPFFYRLLNQPVESCPSAPDRPKSFVFGLTLRLSAVSHLSFFAMPLPPFFGRVFKSSSFLEDPHFSPFLGNTCVCSPFVFFEDRQVICRSCCPPPSRKVFFFTARAVFFFFIF